MYDFHRCRQNLTHATSNQSSLILSPTCARSSSPFFSSFRFIFSPMFDSIDEIFNIKPADEKKNIYIRISAQNSIFQGFIFGGICACMCARAHAFLTTIDRFIVVLLSESTESFHVHITFVNIYLFHM